MTAIWPATSALRSVQRRPAPRGRMASPRRSAVTFGFDAWMAGARPASSPARHVAPSVNASTRTSMRRSKASGIGKGRLSDATADVIHHASSVPPIAPSSEIRRASVTSWRTSRLRLAPIARRMPISFCRPDARASSMLATLAHAISSTRPTTVIRPAAMGTRIGSAVGCRCTSLVAFSDRRRALFVIGLAASSRDMISVRFARASSIDFPGFSRARMNSQRSARRSRRVVPVGDGMVSCTPTGSTSSDADAGIHSSGERTGTMPRKPAGATPTIVYTVPRMRTVRPTTSAAEPSSRVQYRCDTITTRGAAAASSSGRIVRPSRGRTPKTWK